MIRRHVDVELLPDAPLRPVVGPHPQIVGYKTALEGGAGELRCGHVDALTDALRNTADHKMSAGGINGRIPELVFYDGVAVSVVHAEQAAGRETLKMHCR